MILQHCTLKLKLPKYRMKKSSIPQYHKPPCPPPWGLQPCMHSDCIPNKITVGTLLISDHSDCWSLCTHGGATIALESGNLWMWENLVMMLVCACTDCQGRGKENSARKGQKVQDMQLWFDTVKNKAVPPRGSQIWRCCSRYCKVSFVWLMTKNFEKF